MHPGVDTFDDQLRETVWYLLLDTTLVTVTILDMNVNVAFRSLIGNLWPVFGFMGMPGTDNVASTTGMTTGIILIGAQILGLGSRDVCILDQLIFKIFVAGATDIDMGLPSVGATINAIVTTIQSAFVFVILVLICLEVGDRHVMLVILIKLDAKFEFGLHNHIGDIFGCVRIILEDHKHIATATALTEIQIFIASTMIALSLAVKILKLLNGHDLYIRQQALGRSCGSEE